MQRRVTAMWCTAALAALGLSACSEADVVTVHIRLEKGFAGTLSARGLTVPREAAPIEGAVKGVTFEHRAALVCAQGGFQSLGDVRFADVQFVIGTTQDGVSYVHATLPRGPGAKWVDVLLPRKDARDSAAKAFEPDRERTKVGTAVRFVLDVPGAITAHGYAPDARGCKAEAEDRRASLYLTAERAREEGDTWTWSVDWK